MTPFIGMRFILWPTNTNGLDLPRLCKVIAYDKGANACVVTSFEDRRQAEGQRFLEQGFQILTLHAKSGDWSHIEEAIFSNYTEEKFDAMQRLVEATPDTLFGNTIPDHRSSPSH